MSGILHRNVPTDRKAVITIIRAAAATAAAFLALAAAACGSSSSSSAQASSTLLGSTLQQECTTIADILSDGPDPDADPVGYAQAQVLPLKQMTITGDATLKKDVLALADAYQTFSSGSNPGGTAAALQVTKALNAVNAICPGVVTSS